MSANNGTLNNNGVIAMNCNALDVTTKKPDANGKEFNLSRTSRRSCRDVCAIGTLLVFGFMWLIFGLFTTWYPLFDIVLNERLRMSPIYPSFFWWKDPEPEVLLKVYVFNITNSAEFMAGTDTKLKLQEIGPITFQEILEHKDVVFHDENSTLSYTVTRRIVFKDSANIKGILNQTVYVSNMAALSGCTFVNKDFWKRIGYNTMLIGYGTKAIVNATIYNYFFNYTEPVLVGIKKFLPHMVPVLNSGILQNIYENFTNRVNVKIGARHGNAEFFKINTWNYRQSVPNYKPEEGDCNASVVGSSEGAIYPQNNTKDSVLWFWRSTLCRAVPLHFDTEVQVGNLKGYKFILRDDVYDRSENKTADCFKGSDLPNGLSDVSKCFFDQPIVASFPHFYARPGKFLEKLEGLRPEADKHRSYSIIEPVLGVPLNSRAVSQSNVVTGDLSGFKTDIARFSNMVVPMFWLEYYLKEVTPVIVGTVEFIVNTLPKIQYWISLGYIILGLLSLTIGYFRLRNSEASDAEGKKKAVKN